MSYIRESYELFKQYLSSVPLPFKADPAHLDELLKFLAIRGNRDKDKVDNFTIGMRSGPVDEVWHQWLMWTGHYLQGCRYAVGWTIHHAPLVKCDKDEWLMRHSRFRGAYRAEFGPVPPVWGSWDEIVAEHRTMP